MKPTSIITERGDFIEAIFEQGQDDYIVVIEPFITENQDLDKVSD